MGWRMTRGPEMGRIRPAREGALVPRVPVPEPKLTLRRTLGTLLASLIRKRSQVRVLDRPLVKALHSGVFFMFGGVRGRGFVDFRTMKNLGVAALVVGAVLIPAGGASAH